MTVFPVRALGPLLGLLLLVACAPAEVAQEWAFHGETMGTRYVVRIVEPARAAPGDVSGDLRSEVAARIASELEAVNSRMSTYSEASELSRFNTSRSTEPFPLSDETYEVLERALQVAAASDGALDPTVGAIVDAWGFGPAPTPPEAPAHASLTELRQHAGWQKLELLAGETAVRKRDPRLSVDLSAIAKGFAVDEVAAALDSHGFSDYMVEVGGEVRTRGRNPDGAAWRIGIESPAGQGIQRVVSLVDRALATSGDYRNFWTLDGRRFSHTIDPRTGRPVDHAAASVSVVAERCIDADAWATALLVMGPDAGLRRAEELGLAALFLVHVAGGLEERMTSRFAAMLDDPRGASISADRARVGAAEGGSVPTRYNARGGGIP